MTTSFPPVTIPGTEMRTLYSSHVDDEFHVYVALPHGYAGSGEAYPAIYVLDANTFFGTVVECVRVLQIGGEFRRVVVVGVAYPPDCYVQARFRDYTPTARDDFPGSGGAVRFLRFLHEELVPFVQANYRTEPEERCLLSDSASGLFALYALFHEPGLFRRYVIGSPGVAWDEAAVLACESDYASRHADLPATVFLSAGSLEAELVAQIEALAAALGGRGYGGLELTLHLFEGETHWSVVPATISRGLRVVFGKHDPCGY